MLENRADSPLKVLLKTYCRRLYVPFLCFIAFALICLVAGAIAGIIDSNPNNGTALSIADGAQNGFTGLGIIYLLGMGFEIPLMFRKDSVLAGAKRSSCFKAILLVMVIMMAVFAVVNVLFAVVQMPLKNTFQDSLASTFGYSLQERASFKASAISSLWLSVPDYMLLDCIAFLIGWFAAALKERFNGAVAILGFIASIALFYVVVTPLANHFDMYFSANMQLEAQFHIWYGYISYVALGIFFLVAAWVLSRKMPVKV
jgi:hypothetical protein